jgi:hypothetical protein
MDQPAQKNRLSPVFTGWIVGALFVGLLVLLFWPAPKEPPAPPPPTLKRPPSELTKVGLPDDPDLEGLPGFFAVWADYAEWRDNKTVFSYRHPSSKEFMCFFEATRTPQGYRFRSVPRPEKDRAQQGRTGIGIGNLEEMESDVPIAFWKTMEVVGSGPFIEAPKMEPLRPDVVIDLGSSKAAPPELPSGRP